MHTNERLVSFIRYNVDELVDDLCDSIDLDMCGCEAVLHQFGLDFTLSLSTSSGNAFDDVI